MFWRLFISFLLLVVVAVVTVGAIILRRNQDAEIFRALTGELISAAAIIVTGAVVPAYLLARRFTQPLRDLSDGANRLAEGDLGYNIRVGGSREFSALARTFNSMSDSLAASFAQVAEDKKRLRTILSGMAEGVIGVDEDRRVLFANDRARALLDVSIERQQPIAEVVRNATVEDLVEMAMASNEPHRAELEFKGESPRFVAVYAACMPGPSGAVLVLNDVSELRGLERMRQDFAANVSHELKTPLTVIKSTLEALQYGAVDDVAVRGEFLERILAETDRLDALIQDLLRLSRIESGDLALEVESVRVAEAIASGLDRQATRAEAKTLQLIEVPPPEPVAFHADEEVLTTILDNLIDNAIKYTNNGGKVIIRWTATEQTVTLDVQDTGIGIPERDLHRVFERFYRADKARSRAAGGTGLGLAIVKHLVQAMKGQVKVASELGRGSTFSITLPRAPLA